MTHDDPTLAALLDDPTPTGRLVAADRAQELGDDLLEAWLRLLATEGAIGWETYLAGWRIMRFADDGATLNAYQDASCWTFSDGNWYYTDFVVYSGRITRRATPPADLEAAVLSVLRQRLRMIRSV